MTLEEFRVGLSASVPPTDRPNGARPFVCAGSPLTCTAFVVGLNPATEGKFWPYWDDLSGFDKARWFVDYRIERRQRGKSEVSRTRCVIEWIVQAALPVRCLETNIYAVPSGKFANLPKSRRDTAPFVFLLKSIKPKAMLLHGSDVPTRLKGILGHKVFDSRKFAPVPTEWGTVMIRCARHFSHRTLHWSCAEADVLGRELRDAANR